MAPYAISKLQISWYTQAWTKTFTEFIPMGLINITTAMFQIMVWRRTSNKPLYEPVMA